MISRKLASTVTRPLPHSALFCSFTQAGPEWDSDDSEHLDLDGDDGSDEEEGDATTKKSTSADFVALSSAVKKRLGSGKGGKKGGKLAKTPSAANVIYLGHIPHGFYEKQMQGFFSQFGEVSRLRLSRSKKTGQ